MNNPISGLSFFYKEKKNLFFLVLSLFLLVLAASLSCQTSDREQLSSQFLASLAHPVNSGDLFLSPVASTRDYPELSLIQQNSLAGVSSPLLVDPQVLAVKSGAELAEGVGREVREYIIQEGDSLWSIAQGFGLFIDTIVWANDIESPLIRPGQKLLILPVDGVMHLVKEGDKVEDLAKKYKTEAKKIISFNGLSADGQLFSGEVLVVPDGTIPYTQQVSSVSLSRLSTNNFYGRSHDYPYGQCTWWVAQKRAIPSWGNAGVWINNARAAGYEVCQGRYCVPRFGAVISLKGHRLGHVGYVESVKGNKVTFSEMNYLGWGRMNYRTLEITHPSILGYIY